MGFFFERTVTLNEAHFRLRANFATGGIHHVRTAVAAHMQAVERIAAAAIGRLADHHRVVTVFLSHIGAVAILTMEDGVIADDLLEAILVDHGEEGIEDGVAEAETIDLHGEALAFFERHLVVIHILIGNEALDGLVQLQHLRRLEFAVRLLFIHVRKDADEELAGMRDAGLRADAHEVISGRHIGSDGDGEIHLVLFHLLHALLRKAG